MNPYEAYRDKQAFEPLSMGLLGLGAAKAVAAWHAVPTAAVLAGTAVGGHAAANGLNLARSSAGAGTGLSSREIAHSAAVHALHGRVMNGGRREASGLAFGFEAEHMNYGAVHHFTHEVMNHAAFGGDHAAAAKAMYDIANHQDFKAMAQHHPVLQNVQHAWSNLDKETSMKGTVAYNPDSLRFKASEGVKRMGAMGLAAGAGYLEPSLGIHAAWNKGRDLVGRHTPVGAVMTAGLVGKGVAQGKATGVERAATTFLGSPALTSLRDAGAAAGRGMDTHLHAPMAHDIKSRLHATMTDPDALKGMADFMVRSFSSNGEKQGPGMLEKLQDLHGKLTPGSRDAVLSGVNTGYSAAKGLVNTHQDKLRDAASSAYGMATRSLDARRGTPFGMREVGNDVLDASVRKHLPAATHILRHAPDALDATQGALALANHHLEGGAAPARQTRAWKDYAAPLAIAGAAGGTAGLLMSGNDEQKAASGGVLEDIVRHSREFATDHPVAATAIAGTKAALVIAALSHMGDHDKSAALDEIAMADVGALGRFVNTPQPIRPRGRVQTSQHLTSHEALGRILESKNHKHNLNKKGPIERSTFVEAYRRRWVGDHAFQLKDVPLDKLQHKVVPTDPAKVHDIASKWPLEDDGNHPIIGAYDGVTPHVILDGNHRVAAAKQLGEKSLKAYVRDDIAGDFDPIKAAYSCFVPVDLVDGSRWTPHFFPEDLKGHLLTTFRAAQMGDETAATVLAAMRGHEGGHEFNQAIQTLLARK